MSLRAIAWQSRSQCIFEMHSYEIATSRPADIPGLLLAMTYFDIISGKTYEVSKTS